MNKTFLLIIVAIIYIINCSKAMYQTCTSSGCDNLEVSEPKNNMQSIAKQIQHLIPVLDFALYKGQCGKIGVIGGSLEVMKQLYMYICMLTFVLVVACIFYFMNLKY